MEMTKDDMTQLDVRLERFLFAVIGNGEGEIPLSVISGLARCGSDPWAEAARLSTLPKAKAADALTLFIAKISPRWCSVSDPPGTVANLVKLLPGPESPMPSPRSLLGQFRVRYERALLAMLIGLLFVAVVLGYALR
jgi:hypothetical protein